jgi:hypothetical protein
MSNKQAEGFSAIPVLFVIALAAIGLLFLRQQLKPVPATPPMYKVGECGKNSLDADSDRTQVNDDIYFKIVAVGKKNYELLTGQFGDKVVRVKLNKQSIETLDPGTEKVPCPKELNDPKTLEKARDY